MQTMLEIKAPSIEMPHEIPVQFGELSENIPMKINHKIKDNMKQLQAKPAMLESLR